jgi:hypothetical protein
MNKHVLPLITLSCLVASCDPATPNDYFGRAVLNLNMFHDFAGARMDGELKQPSMRLADGGGKEVVQMTRKEVVDDKVEFAEASYEKVRKLKETEETREMLQASKAVYEYILPVYRNEYRELAKLYDNKAPQTEIDVLSGNIRQKYADGFRTRMDAVVTAAKPYAERHGLKVQWDVRTSPPPR